MAQRILVTGANGFIGRHCTRALADAGWEVVAIGRQARPQPHIARSLQCDLLDITAAAALVRGAAASHMLHLAWHDGPRDRWTSPSNLDWAAATLSLARAFVAGGGERMIFAGSCAEYDWGAPVLSEATTPLNPASLYGAAKAATGGLLRAAQAALGISVAEARIFFCYGPGEPKGRLISDLLEGLAQGVPVRCTDGLQKRDYLHAADVARALTLVAGSGIEGAVNIASGKAIAVRDLVQTAARQMGRPDLPVLGALPRAADDPAVLVGDVARLGALGFKPVFDLETGIADTIARWRQDTP